MKLRKEQIDAFCEPRVKEFEDYMVDHLNKWFPEECNRMGEEELRSRIRDEIERAEDYDIIGRRDVCKFIDVSFALGHKFDVDPSLQWASAILRDEGLDPSERVTKLVEETLEYRRQAAAKATESAGE